MAMYTYLKSTAFFLVLILLGSPTRVSPAAESPADSMQSYERQLTAQEKRLHDLRNQIQELRSLDGELKQKEVGTLEQLKILDKEVALTTELLRRLAAKQTRVEGQLGGIRAEHATSKEALSGRKRQLGRTLRSMYINGSANSADVLLRTTSLRNAMTRFKYLGLMARNNERLLMEIRDQETSLAVAAAQLTESLSEISSTASEAAREKRNLEDSRVMRQRALNSVVAERSEHQKLIETLASSEQQVEALIRTLEKTRETARAAGLQDFPDIGFQKLRGRMSWPVQGTIIRGFGRQRHPKYRTLTMSSGVDIRAEAGSAVRSVARARVEYVAWLDGYGRTVILNHGGGHYTVYAHLDEVFVTVEDNVGPGQVIGSVGETASIEGPKLHFEIRAGGTGRTVDPMGWLAR